MSDSKPNPGSDAANKAGCRCPIMDNAYGRGCGMRDEHGKPLFWIADDCPLHAPAAVLEQRPEIEGARGE